MSQNEKATSRFQYQQNKQTEHFFNIDLKVGGKLLVLNVDRNDSIQTLLAKYNIGNHKNQQKFNRIKQHIKDNIKQIIMKLNANDTDLTNKLQKFLDKQQNDKQNQQIKQKTIKGNNSETKQTPFKMLLQKTHNKLPKSQNVIQKQNHSKKYKQKSQSLSALKQIISVNKNVEIVKKQQNFNKQENKKNKKKLDDDLVKAYELIIKKSKDKQMREMAENTLKQYNLYQTGPLQQKQPILYTKNTDKTDLQSSNLSNNNQTNHKKTDSNLTIKISNSQKSPQSINQLQKTQKTLQQTHPKRQQSSFIRKTRGYSYSNSIKQVDKDLNLVYQYKQNSQKRQNTGFLYLNGYNNQYLRNNYQTKFYNNCNSKSDCVTNANKNKRYSYLTD